MTKLNCWRTLVWALLAVFLAGCGGKDLDGRWKMVSHGVDLYVLTIKDSGIYETNKGTEKRIATDLKKKSSNLWHATMILDSGDRPVITITVADKDTLDYSVDTTGLSVWNSPILQKATLKRLD